MERLGISKGSASQGLKFLRTAGAIHMVYVSGDRRMHFEAVAQLRDLNPLPARSNTAATGFQYDPTWPHQWHGEEPARRRPDPHCRPGNTAPNLAKEDPPIFAQGH